MASDRPDQSETEQENADQNDLQQIADLKTSTFNFFGDFWHLVGYQVAPKTATRNPQVPKMTPKCSQKLPKVSPKALLRRIGIMCVIM